MFVYQRVNLEYIRTVYLNPKQVSSAWPILKLQYAGKVIPFCSSRFPILFKTIIRLIGYCSALKLSHC